MTADETTGVLDHFSLRTMPGAIAGFRFPTEDFDPRGAWKLSYTLFSVPVGTTRAGALTLERRHANDGKAVLRVASKKQYGQHCVQEVVGEIEYGANRLAVPARWSYSARLTTLDGQTIARSAIQKSAFVRDRTLHVRCGRHDRTFSLGPSYTMSWTLFDAVQRLPRERTVPLSFTLVDHFDQVKPEHALWFRKSVVIDMEKGGWERLFPSRPAHPAQRAARAHLFAYEQTGRGVLPIVYWVDEAGRLLFVGSGIEAYVLDPTGAAETQQT